MSKLSPRQRRRQKTKQAILETARELITEEGLEGLSLREIARRIDYSPAGLYEYFKSKDEIVEAVCIEGFERLSAYLNRVSADLPPAERLFQLGLAYLDFAHNNPDYFLLIFTAFPTGEVTLEELGEDAASTYGVLVQAIQTAIEAGLFRPPAERNLNEIAYAMWATVHGLAMLQQTNFRHSQADLEPVHRWTLELFLKGLKAG